MNPTTHVTIVGNLTRDPELRFIPNGTPVASFGLAVNKRRRNDKGEWEDAGADFYNVSAWRQLGQNAADSLGKGARVVISGRLTHRTWETENGERRSAVEVVADDIGASLQWATVTVERNERRSSDRAPHPADDYPEPEGQHAPDLTEEPF